MSVVQVVVRPRPETAPSRTFAPLYGLFDVIVDGVNITARLGDGQALALLADLGHAVAALGRGKRDRVTLQFYADDEAWEIGLEADAADVLISVYRSGPCPELAVHERRVEFSALQTAVAKALDEAPVHKAPPGVVTTLVEVRKLVTSSLPNYGRRPSERVVCPVVAKPVSGFGFSALSAFRKRHTPSPAHAGAQLERADLHALLGRGKFTTSSRGRNISAENVCLFLVAERLLALAEDVFDAWRSERALFRRANIDGTQISVRRGPGDVPLTLTVKSRDSKIDNEGMSFPGIDARTFVQASVRFASALIATFVDNDPSQAHNLRLKSLERSASALGANVADSVADDSVTNPEPDSYRSFGLPRPRKESPAWAQGAKMRFVPRWAATVPTIDLRATFLCGERIIVGSARETACIERTCGDVLWRMPTPRAASVVTPLGLARLQPDGMLSMHDLNSGEVRFSTHVAPRASGGACGALVNAAGLPKLLVVAEGDRAITAIDLVSGDVRWRFSARRPANYRVRRAGKLILVAGGDSALLALDVATGEVVWRVRDRLPFSGDMTIDHDSAFAMSGGPVGPAKLYHVDLWTGSVRWTRDIDERPALGHAPLLASDIVAVPTRDRRGMGVAAYSRSSGEQLWEQAPGLVSPMTAWLSVDDALIANSASGALLCIEAATGVLRYNHVFSRHVDADQPRRLEPVLRNGALFVPQHEVHVVRPRDGEIIGSVPSDLIPDLLRVDERCNVYIAEESGHLAAFSVAPRLSLVK